MIESKKKLHEYLMADASLYPKQTGNLYQKFKNCMATNPINTQHLIWKYVSVLRYSEYYYNNSLFTPPRKCCIKRCFNTLLTVYYFYKLRKVSYKTGIQIPPNTCGPGLQNWHYGYIIINGATQIGKNLIIYPGVEIGHKVVNGGCPIIGDNVFIGSGAKIFGNIKIGNNVTIAANSVVLNDIPDYAVVGGVPAKIIKFKSK